MPLCWKAHTGFCLSKHTCILSERLGVLAGSYWKHNNALPKEQCSAEKFDAFQAGLHNKEYAIDFPT